MVENTTIGIQRDVKFLLELAQITGVHVVAGTGTCKRGRRSENVALPTKVPFLV